ncbi:MAG: UDP-2,3-diacylglucosamine diphosphatase [Cellvibrionaceae bacterium]|nr:UDP-2,3-diacylglucosamine diphosphatase [Cellvibrionaceae bacterium]
MAYYFISDLHLGGEMPDTLRLLEHLLKRIATDLSHLYILGDLFDAWIGDDEDSESAQQVIRTLRAVSASNIACYFIHGNRDFLVGERFAQETGFNLLPEHHPLTIHNRKVLLMHGDSLCVDDAEYMQFRAQVRNPAWQQTVLAMPLQQRREMARQLRSQSKSMNSVKAEDIMDVNDAAVDAAMFEHGANLLIHGHTHRPAVHDLAEGKQRVVLGDWRRNSAWYCRLDASGVELIHLSE